MTVTEHWYSKNILMMQRHLPSCRMEFDRTEGTWIKLRQFPLPRNFDVPRSTDLLFLLAGITRPITTPPLCFYLDQHLRTRGGRTPDHIFNVGSVHQWPDLSRQGYALYCVMLKEWNPALDVVSGDNLLTVVNTIYSTLAEL